MVSHNGEKIKIVLKDLLKEYEKSLTVYYSLQEEIGKVKEKLDPLQSAIDSLKKLLSQEELKEINLNFKEIQSIDKNSRQISYKIIEGGTNHVPFLQAIDTEDYSSPNNDFGHEPLSEGERNLMKNKSITASTIELIKKNGPMKGKTLFNALRENGLTIRGKKPYDTMRATLGKSPKVKLIWTIPGDRFSTKWDLVEEKSSIIPVSHDGNEKDELEKKPYEGMSILESCMDALIEKGPLSSKTLLDIIKKRGSTVGGQKPLNTMMNVLATAMRTRGIVSRKGIGESSIWKLP